MSITLRVTNGRHSVLASGSFVYTSPADFHRLCQMANQEPASPDVVARGVYALVKDVAFSVAPSDLILTGQVFLNPSDRNTVRAPHLSDIVRVANLVCFWHGPA